MFVSYFSLTVVTLCIIGLWLVREAQVMRLRRRLDYSRAIRDVLLRAVTFYGMSEHNEQAICALHECCCVMIDGGDRE